MKNRVLGVCLSLFAGVNIQAQSDCAGGRYVTYDLFPNVSVTSDIVFGENIGVNGSQEILELDVYEPAGDSNTERPVVIVAFGGSFINGAKEDVSTLCEELAELGYVAVAPNYRVGLFLPNAATTSRAVLRGAHDIKAAIRYLYRSVIIDGNPWGIDTTRILVGGVSAGAISAIHAVYLDEQAEFPQVLSADSASLGNVAGNSGNLGFSEEVLGVWSMSGAIADTLMIQAGDPPIASIHDVGDFIVPYFTQQVSVLGIPTGLIASGSHDVHSYANSLGIDNCLLEFPGSGHVSYLNSDFDGSFGFIVDFFADLVCGQSPDCGQIIASVPERPQDRLQIYPNPTTGSLTIGLDKPAVIELRNMVGQLIEMKQYQRAGQVAWDMRALPEGMYSITVREEGKAQSQLLIKQ